VTSLPFFPLPPASSSSTPSHHFAAARGLATGQVASSECRDPVVTVTVTGEQLRASLTVSHRTGKEDDAASPSRRLPEPKKPAVRTPLAPSSFCASLHQNPHIGSIGPPSSGEQQPRRRHGPLCVATSQRGGALCRLFCDI
jgi:hypothetical protein